MLDFTTITEIPRTPDFMSGVINLRGSVVPVVDLRLCFEMSKTESTRNTCIVVVEVLLDDESTVIGALADSVEEVIDLEPDQIQPAPRIGTQIRTDFIKGMGKRDTQFIMILDIDRVFSAEELSAVRSAEASRAAGGSDRLMGRTRVNASAFSAFLHDRPMTTSMTTLTTKPSRTRILSGSAQPDLRSSRASSLSADKKTMLEVRIKRRLTSLNLPPTREYCDYLFGHRARSEEMVHLIDVVTTNKTDFFREQAHFDFLVAKALPDLTAAQRQHGASCWSGAPAAPPAKSLIRWRWC